MKLDLFFTFAGLIGFVSGLLVGAFTAPVSFLFVCGTMACGLLFLFGYIRLMCWTNYAIEYKE